MAESLLPNTFLSGSALILGASSGMGEACAAELSAAGMDVFGVHLDRKSTIANANAKPFLSNEPLSPEHLSPNIPD